MSDFAPMKLEEIQAQAKKLGCEVVVAQPSQLQFDLDTPQSLEQFAKFEGWIKKTYSGLPRVSGWASKSGHQHRVVEYELFASWTTEARIAMQVMGGSDARREYAALHCHWAGSPHPVLLFKPIETRGAQ